MELGLAKQNRSTNVGNSASGSFNNFKVFPEITDVDIQNI